MVRYNSYLAFLFHVSNMSGVYNESNRFRLSGWSFDNLRFFHLRLVIATVSLAIRVNDDYRFRRGNSLSDLQNGRDEYKLNGINKTRQSDASLG